ncbi:MAG: terminase [Lachnospiraceae bacterium]|nr:terminase [Lachnospiraceae bacterium]
MDTRIGRQSPTVSVILPYSDTKGPEAVELYNGTERTAQEWQEALLYDIMAVNEQGLWIHQKFGYSIPRRNGKSEDVLMRCLWGLDHGERILYTAHRATTSHAVWERLGRLCEKSDITVLSSFRAFGKEHLYCEGDAVIEFRTRTSTGGLGEGYDLLIIDEAQEYTPEQETSLKYVVSDSLNPQTIMLGTPPTAISAGTVFPKFRTKVLQGESYESGWAEWSVPEQTDLNDVEAWYETNPSLGTILKERTIRSEIGDDAIDFNIQRLGLWIKYNQKSAISKNEWQALETDKLPKLNGQLFAGIKFGIDGNNVALSIAVRTDDGKIFLEAYACKPVSAGMAWILNFIDKADVCKVAVDGKSGTGILEDAMKQAKLKKPIIPSVAEFIKANAMFEQALSSASIVHMKQSAAEQVITNCEKRAIGSGGGFGYKSQLEGADIAILDSMILAHWLCVETKAKKTQTIAY